MLTRILFSFITITLCAQAYALRSLQFDIGNQSYHLGYLATFYHGESGALALSPDIIFRPAGETIFAPAAYWYTEPNNAFVKEISYGIRAYLAEYEHHQMKNDVQAVGLGVMARSQALSLNWPFYLVATLHYAPDGITFGDAQNLLAWSALLEYELFGEFYLYAGYRNIGVESTLHSGVAHLQDTAFLGSRFMF